MTAAELKQRPRLLSDPPCERQRGANPFSGRRRDGRSDGGGLTLEQLLDGVWEGARTAGAATCPLCQGTVTAGDRFAECRDCGTKLA